MCQIITLKKCFPVATTWTPTGRKPDLKMAPPFPLIVSPLRTNTATPLRSEQNWIGYYIISLWSMPNLCWVMKLSIISHLAVTMVDWKTNL